MIRELITTWQDYQEAIDRLLPLAQRHICIYDNDLEMLKLESPIRQDELARFLKASPGNSLEILIRQGDALRTRQPRTLSLLKTYDHQIKVHETPSHLAHLRDSMLIVDGQHGLIRFEQNMSRSKLLIDAGEETHGYQQRFNEIRNESSEPFAATTLGL